MDNKQSLPPPPMADILGPLLKAEAIIAGGQLGLFKALAEGPRSVPDIAKTIDANEMGVTMLVEALASVGYLERAGDKYANGPIARAWLTSTSKIDFTPFLMWASVGWHMMESLNKVIKDGNPQQPLYKYLQSHPEAGQNLARYHKANAQLGATPIVHALSLPENAQRLLDLGGSHGLYSTALCKQYPKLKAVVFDLSVALSETKKNIAAEGLSDRVSIQAGDYLKDDIGQGYDVILCFFLPHNHTEDENKRLIAKVSKALNPGGMIVIHEFVKGDPPDAFNALYSLLFFMYSGTRNYSYKEITKWLADAGLSDFKRTDLPPGGQSSLITAIKI